jgi:DNA-binding GntR family transcriptional regulator
MPGEMTRDRAERTHPAQGARRSQTQRAYLEIRRRILANEMAPNSNHLEQELAVALGMSRTPVREALIRLAEERLVEVRPRHGARVLPVSADDMREVYDLLTVLEEMIARELAGRGLSPAELAGLEASVAAMDRALAADDLDLWAAEDDRFHRTLADLSHNSRLRQIIAMFWDQVHRARMQTLRLRPKPVASNRDHAALVAAIRARDADRAGEIHRRHREQAGRMLLQLLTRRGLDAL